MAEHEVRIYSADYGQLIRVHGVPGGIEITADVGDQGTTVLLDMDGVRKLRLELQRRERAAKRATMRS